MGINGKYPSWHIYLFVSTTKPWQKVPTTLKTSKQNHPNMYNEVWPKISRAQMQGFQSRIRCKSSLSLHWEPHNGKSICRHSNQSRIYYLVCQYACLQIMNHCKVIPNRYDHHHGTTYGCNFEFTISGNSNKKVGYLYIALV